MYSNSSERNSNTGKLGLDSNLLKWLFTNNRTNSVNLFRNLKQNKESFRVCAIILEQFLTLPGILNRAMKTTEKLSDMQA